jgi:hypothetical protein
MAASVLRGSSVLPKIVFFFPFSLRFEREVDGVARTSSTASVRSSYLGPKMQAGFAAARVVQGRVGEWLAKDRNSS